MWFGAARGEDHDASSAIMCQNRDENHDGKLPSSRREGKDRVSEDASCILTYVVRRGARVENLEIQVRPLLATWKSRLGLY